MANIPPCPPLTGHNTVCFVVITPTFDLGFSIYSNKMSHITHLYPDSINQHTNACILDTHVVAVFCGSQAFGHLIIDTFVFPFLEGQKREKNSINAVLMVR